MFWILTATIAVEVWGASPGLGVVAGAGSEQITPPALCPANAPNARLRQTLGSPTYRQQHSGGGRNCSSAPGWRGNAEPLRGHMGDQWRVRAGLARRASIRESCRQGPLSRPASEAGAAPPSDAQGCVSPVPSFESSPSKLAPCASQSPTLEDRIPIAVGVATELRSAGDWTSPLIWPVTADYGANEVSHLSEPRVRAGSRRLPRDYLHSREHGCLNRCDGFRHSLAGARTLSVSPTVDIPDGV